MASHRSQKPPAQAVDAERIEALLRKLKAGTPLADAQDLSLIGNIVASWAHLCERAQRFDLSLADLRRMLGVLGRPPVPAPLGKEGSSGPQTTSPDADTGVSDPSGAPLAHADGDSTETEAAPAAPDLATDPDTVDTPAVKPDPGPESGDPRARTGHGRRGQADFGSLPWVQHNHESLAIGCLCSGCEQGRLYRFFPRTFVSISGQASFVGHRHSVERLQCNVCGRIFEARLPEPLRVDGVGEGRLYSHSAHSTVVLLKYLGVMPWHRQQTVQSAMGVMVPDACMWDMCESVSTTVRPVTSALQTLASAAPLFYGDDTTATIFGLTLEVKTDRKTGKEVNRTGCHTTAVIARFEDGRRIAVFRVGIQHAGELLDEILVSRPAGLPKPMVMADASSSNGVTVCEVHKCGCNAHALRRFKELDKAPTEAEPLLTAYRKVFAHDAHTRAEKMSDTARLAYHRTHSRPLFKQMCRDAYALLEEHKVEPNSVLGKALDYLLNHELSLSAFFRLPGAPIDNNLLERELRLPVRLRDAAPLYRSQIGANVAGELWTLLVTVLLNGVDVLAYLNALQRHARDVRKDPMAWLPWNYEARAKELDCVAAAAPARDYASARNSAAAAAAADF